MITVGVIGSGYWGPNLIRNINELGTVNLKYICDKDNEVLREIKERYLNISLVNDYNIILNDNEVDAIIIATPAITHYRIVKDSLLKNKHVFVEKPITNNVKDGYELASLAKEKSLKLMVGHVFVHSGPVKKVKELITSGAIGEIKKINSQRFNFGKLRWDVNVLWDLAPHDISIIQYWLGTGISSVLAYGSSSIKQDLEDDALLVLESENSIKSYIHCSLNSPEKVRRMEVVGSDGMIVFDDTLNENKVKLFLKSIKINNGSKTFTYEDKGVKIIDHDSTEPIKLELINFINSILGEEEILTDAYNGIEVLKVLEASNKSILLNGSKVNVLN